MDLESKISYCAAITHALKGKDTYGLSSGMVDGKNGIAFSVSSIHTTRAASAPVIMRLTSVTEPYTDTLLTHTQTVVLHAYFS